MGKYHDKETALQYERKSYENSIDQVYPYA